MFSAELFVTLSIRRGGVIERKLNNNIIDEKDSIIMHAPNNMSLKFPFTYSCYSCLPIHRSS